LNDEPDDVAPHHPSRQNEYEHRTRTSALNSRDLSTHPEVNTTEWFCNPVGQFCGFVAAIARCLRCLRGGMSALLLSTNLVRKLALPVANWAVADGCETECNRLEQLPTRSFVVKSVSSNAGGGLASKMLGPRSSHNTVLCKSPFSR
jgi:hypothetical protein